VVTQQLPGSVELSKHLFAHLSIHRKAPDFGKSHESVKSTPLQGTLLYNQRLWAKFQHGTAAENAQATERVLENCWTDPASDIETSRKKRVPISVGWSILLQPKHENAVWDPARLGIQSMIEFRNERIRGIQVPESTPVLVDLIVCKWMFDLVWVRNLAHTYKLGKLVPEGYEVVSVGEAEPFFAKFD
jgi:hypothetical protein